MASVDQYSLVVSGDVRETLGLSVTEVSDDSLIANLINRLSTRIESYCGRKFVAREYTEYHDGDKTNAVIVDNPPIISVSGLWDDIDREFTSNEEITSDNYVVYSNEGYLSLYNDEVYFSRGVQNIKVVYSGGYTTIPYDLQDACINWVLTEYRRVKDKHHAFGSKSAPGGSISIDSSAVPQNVKFVLDLYKKKKLG